MQLNPRNAVMLDHRPTKAELKRISAERGEPFPNSDGTPGKWMYWWEGIDDEQPYATEN